MTLVLCTFRLYTWPNYSHIITLQCTFYHEKLRKMEALRSAEGGPGSTKYVTVNKEDTMRVLRASKLL